jgi:hypothetical protein
MGAKAAKAGASEFLERFKAGVAAGELLFVPREQNLGVLTALGLTIGEAEQIILNLTEANISSGHEHDQKGSPGVAWFFHVFEAGRSLTIELKISDSLTACLYFGSPERLAQTNIHEKRHTL